MHHILCVMTMCRMEYVDCCLVMLCEVMNDMLVMYVMKMLIDVMYTRSIIESCHKMCMKLECIFMLCNLSCNVGYVICHVM